jgi:quercetin dioxygenase-like cupin family protein
VRTLLAAMIAILAVSATARAQEAAPSETVARPADLTWNPGGGGYAEAEFAGVFGRSGAAEPFVFRMRMPASWTMPAHRHDTAEHITVLSGTLTMKYTADGEPVTLPPGSFVSVPAGNPMWAWTGDDPVEIQVHGTGPFSTTPVE